MALYLIELTPQEKSREAAESLIQAATSALTDHESEVIESQVTAGYGQVFVIIESDAAEAAAEALRSALEGTASLTGPDEVRLVGAELEDIKTLKKSADYLVEWDIPAEITMEKYLARKKANAPKYAQVPEVSFLRTYVREDTAKCLCFYDAPDEKAVTRAREAVETPIDRLHKLES